ncbi:MAG TPA: DUF58 domain-containing protein [Chloroflexota bacterium]|nr:DUF58 domain-containing protein [Chloroflexota bacterium]
MSLEDQPRRPLYAPPRRLPRPRRARPPMRYAIFSPHWLLILSLATALGAWLGQPLLMLGGLFGLLIAGAEQLWMRECLTGLEYERSLSTASAKWGDEVTLTLRIANRKLLPLTWLQTEDRVPTALPISRARVVDSRDGPVSYLRNLLPMLPYEQLIRSYAITCRRRGLFEFGPGAVQSGDLLGFASRTLRVPHVDQLIVYPKLFELEFPPLLSRRIVGLRSANRLILTDPSRTIGLRSYQAGDPLRHVEWRASARSRDLQVRVFEPTTDLTTAIFLNLRMPTFSWANEDTPALEFCISLAASLARWSLERKYPAGVFGNGARGEGGALRVPASGDPGQLQRILEALALAEPYGQAGVAEVLLSEAPSLPFEASVVLITAMFDHRLMTAIEEVRRRRPVTVWFVKTRPGQAPELPGVSVVTIEYDDYWEQLDRVQLAA